MKRQTKETQTLINNLEKWRCANGFSQSEFAKQIGITPAHYSKLLSGDIATINADCIYKIYNITGHLCFQLMEIYTDDFLRLSRICRDMTADELRLMLQIADGIIKLRN